MVLPRIITKYLFTSANQVESPEATHCALFINTYAKSGGNTGDARGGMVGRKSKGLNAEREMIHKFWNNGWTACRVAGSGSTRYPAPDIIAGNNVRKIVMECKVTRGVRQYLRGKEISELQEFADKFGAEPWVGVKFDRADWYFLTLEDLHDAGEGFSVSIPLAKRRGFSFDEIVGL